MTRIAIIGTRGYPSHYGGFETAVRKLAPFLADEGCDVVVYGRSSRSGDDGQSGDPRVKVVYTRGVERKSLSTLTFGLTAVLHAARNPPDVALVMNVANGFWLPILKLAGVPTLVNVDGIEWSRAKWGKIAKAVFYWGARATARFASRRVYDSLEIERRWKLDFRHGEGIFIPYGGDVPPKLPMEPGLNHRGYVLVVARLVPENSIGEFFDIVPKLAEQYPVVIVGSAGYGGELDERARQLSRLDGVTWLGHISDDSRLASLWQHAGAYFHGHTVGGTNPALVQAMACGAPVVARDTVYNREVLGDAGLFAETKDEIMKQIVRLLEDQEIATTLVNRAINRARDHYSWGLVCNRYLQHLVELAKS